MTLHTGMRRKHTVALHAWMLGWWHSMRMHLWRIVIVPVWKYIHARRRRRIVMGIHGRTRWYRGNRRAGWTELTRWGIVRRIWVVGSWFHVLTVRHPRVVWRCNIPTSSLCHIIAPRVGWFHSNRRAWCWQGQTLSYCSFILQSCYNHICKIVCVWETPKKLSYFLIVFFVGENGCQWSQASRLLGCNSPRDPHSYNCENGSQKKHTPPLACAGYGMTNPVSEVR